MVRQVGVPDGAPGYDLESHPLVGLVEEGESLLQLVSLVGAFRRASGRHESHPLLPACVSVGKFGDIGLAGRLVNQASVLSLQGIGDHQPVQLRVEGSPAAFPFDF